MKYLGFFLIICMVLTASAEASSSRSASSEWCRLPKNPQIKITTNTDRINWFFNYSQSQLNNFDVDTVNPYGNSIHTDVGGLMKGGISMTQTMRFNTITHKGLRQSCLFYETVTVDLKIEPNIYIAREYPPGSCKHNAIKGHELKHINEDRLIVNKYANVIGQILKAEIDKQSLYGPVSVAQEQQISQIMRSRMENILRSVNQKMEVERRARQQEIDNMKEYERVNNLCR